MIVIFSVLHAPQYPRPLALPSPLLAHQQPTLTGEQFEDCLDLFQLCLHALILNSLALHAEWSKLWTRSGKGKGVTEKSHQALSPFTQWLNFILEAKNTFAKRSHFTQKNITLMDHFGSTMVKIFSNIHDIEHLL